MVKVSNLARGDGEQVNELKNCVLCHENQTLCFIFCGKIANMKTAAAWIIAAASIASAASEPSRPRGVGPECKFTIVALLEDIQIDTTFYFFQSPSSTRMLNHLLAFRIRPSRSLSPRSTTTTAIVLTAPMNLEPLLAPTSPHSHPRLVRIRPTRTR